MSKWAKLGLALFTTIVMSGCGKDDSAESKTPPPPQEPVNMNLGELSAGQNCLSLPLLNAALEGAQFPAFSYPTELEVTSKHQVRMNFKRQLAYGILTVEEGPISQIFAIEPVTQDLCNNVTIAKNDGSLKTLKIKAEESTPSSLYAMAEDGESITYEVLGPRRLKITQRYVAFDVPCVSEKKEFYVSVAKVIDWNQSSAPSSVIATDSELAIEENLISLAAESVGISEQGFYFVSNSEDGTPIKAIDMGKIREVSGMQPSPEILACYSSDPMPPTPPEEE